MTEHHARREYPGLWRAERKGDRRFKQRVVAGSMAAVLGMLGTKTALAFEIDAENPELKVRWDNTLKYSAAARLRNPSDTLTSITTAPGANLDDGDRNFNRGVISNRVDLLSEFDISYRDFGARVSGAAWYDSVYHQTNDNNSPNSANAASVPFNQFTRATKNLMGQDAEILDAFIYGKGDVGDLPASFRIGRHALLYGESLFFGANGIAGAQSPVDVIKAIGVPNSQFKEIIRPVNQVSGQIGINPNSTLGAYYKFQWERNLLPPVGSYFSYGDILDKGGERLIAATPNGPFTVLRRDADTEAKNSGQFGAQLKYRPDGDGGEWGFYAVRFHSPNPIVYQHFNSGQYNLVYPEGIKAYGLSFSTTVGGLQVSSEGSVRDNMPFQAPGGAVKFFAPTNADNSGNPAYAVGRSAHVQVSWIYNMPRTPLWESAFFLGEIAWNRRLSISKNPSQLNPTSTRDASAIWLSLQPKYFQVLSGLDLTVPITLTYGINGKSSVVDFSPSAPQHGGSVTIGLVGNYRNTWTSTLNYTHFYGPGGQLLDQKFNNAYLNVWKDRDFVSLSVQRTF